MSTATSTSRKSSGRALARQRTPRGLRRPPRGPADERSSTSSASSGKGAGRGRRRSARFRSKNVFRSGDEQIAEIALGAPQEPRLGGHAGIRLLNEVLGVLARAAERPSRAVEPVEMVADARGVEQPGGADVRIRRGTPNAGTSVRCPGERVRPSLCPVGDRASAAFVAHAHSQRHEPRGFLGRTRRRGCTHLPLAAFSNLRE